MVLWAGSAAGSAAQVIVVVCANNAQLQAVLTLSDQGHDSIKHAGAAGGDTAGEAHQGDADARQESRAGGLGPRPTIPVCGVVVSLIAGHSHARVSRHRILHEPVGMLEVALRCVYACQDVNAVTAKAMSDIYCTLPKREATLIGRVADRGKYDQLQDRVDLFEFALCVCVCVCVFVLRERESVCVCVLHVYMCLYVYIYIYMYI